MTELWAFCAECDRWFYCDTAVGDAQCPVCCQPAAEVAREGARADTA